MITFRDFLVEGGAALPSVTRISQEEIHKLLPDLIKKVAMILDIKKNQIRVVGSAGKKEEGELSGDIDLAVEFPADKIEGKLSKLAHDEKSCRSMSGINVYSFAEKFGDDGKLVQIDLMPTPNVDYAAWAMQSNPADLERGLKGAHRNELLFATTKHAGLQDKGEEIERYFYDLSRGLFRGTQVKKKSGYQTTEKKFVTNDVDSIVKTLYGHRATPQNTSTFSGILELIHSDTFPHAHARDKILDMAKTGMKKKGLKIPKMTLGEEE